MDRMHKIGNRFYFFSSLFFVSGAALNLAGLGPQTAAMAWVNLIGCLLFFGGATVNLLDKSH